MKKKVAILGGGTAAITVAMQLTEDPNWSDTFESITIYQMGWRLGGKGATGRVGPNKRILEHGLHIWLGFYENAFKLIKAIYQDAGRPPGAPLATWQQAFTKHSFVGVDEFYGGEWIPWMMAVPTNNRIPGEGNVPSLGGSMKDMMSWIVETWQDNASELPAYLAFPMLNLIEMLETVELDEQATATLAFTLKQLSIVSGLSAASGLLDTRTRRLALLMEMAATILRGLLLDNIKTYGELEKLENIDLAQWLRNFNNRPGFADLNGNPLLRGLYDFAFAFENGDVSRPNFAAAPALRTVFRMLLTYKGAIFWKMNAGMGDTIFAPAYEALHKRGVDFKFFHKVKRLELSADKTSLARIHIGLQATLKDGIYDPLIPVTIGDPPSALPLPCWPNEPRYEQLVEGDALRDGEIDLESFWTTRQDVEEIVLEAGADFDVAVFGISLGSVPYLCKELMDSSPKWNDMATKVATVRTQALQLWLTPTILTLGWTQASPIIDAWIEPLDTWADMTDVMSCESWSSIARPGSLAYFCGPMMGGIPPQGDSGFPAQALADVQATADQMLSNDIDTLWTALGAAGLPASAVVARYERANINPSDRYVQSVADTAKFRLAADGSGFANLVITGDWILNGYNGGCIEASVWSGIQAANAILGRPLDEGVMNGDSAPF